MCHLTSVGMDGYPLRIGRRSEGIGGLRLARNPRSEYGFQWRLMMESETKKRTTHKNEFVKLTNLETNEVKFYRNGLDASMDIGCPHVLVSRALRNEGEEEGKGNWRVEYISKDDPQCEEFKQKMEDRRRDIRKSLVEYAHTQMLKRKEFVEGEKAKRKAQHDELVRSVRSMVSCALESLKEQLQEEAEDYK